MKRSPLILTTILLVLGLAFGQDKAGHPAVDAKRLDALFDALESNDKMMGVVRITKDGRAVYNRALGYARISGAGKVRNSEETRFPVASLTKTFTAVMIFQLIEEKKLTLETRLSKFFPQIANADKITINHLLTHRSGIHNFSLDEDYQEWKTRAHTRAEILARFAAYRPEFEPGEKEIYSNTAYVLLGYVIEDLTGSTYGEQLNKRIVGKIGLKNTHLGGGAAGGADRPDEEALSYTFADGKWNEVSTRTAPSNSAGAGAIVSTAADVDRFVAALFDGQLIGGASLQIMTTPDAAATGDDTAKGIARIAFNNKTKIGFTYDGSVDAFGSVYFYVPSDKLGVVVITNGENYPSGEIFWLVMRILYGAPAAIPSFAPLALTDEKLSKFEGTYVLDGTFLKIGFRKENSKLLAQVIGTPPITLEAIGETKFQFKPDGILIEFLTAESGEVNRVSIYKDRQKTFWTKEK